MYRPPCDSEPERTIAALIVGRLRECGYLEVRPVGDDMLDVVMCVDLAFGEPDGLLFAIMAGAASRYQDAWLHRSGIPWPFEVVDDADGMMGRRIQFNGDTRGMVVSMLCCAHVLEQLIASGSPPVLEINLSTKLGA